MPQRHLVTIRSMRDRRVVHHMPVDAPSLVFGNMKSHVINRLDPLHQRVAICDEELSLTHCCVDIEDEDRIVVTNLCGKDDIKVRDQVVEERAEARLRDKVRFGEWEIELCDADAIEASTLELREFLSEAIAVIEENNPGPVAGDFLQRAKCALVRARIKPETS
jgi:hypothetical protein